MLILITSSLMFATALTLIILQITRPEFRFAWLIAVGGTFLAWISVWLWQTGMPLSLQLLPWQPAALFSESPTFSATIDVWPYALSLVTLAGAILLTASVRDNFPSVFAWAGSLTLCTLGLLAVTAANPLTLALVWAALDLTELVTILRSVQEPAASQRAVIAFSTHGLSIALLLWADILTISTGKSFDFSTLSNRVGLYLVLAAGLRLGVLPLHLPYRSLSGLRRGFGTTLRLVSAAASLALLARIPASSLNPAFVPVLLLLAGGAALYGGWMWLRAPDELTGRPFWIIGMAGLAVSASLRGNALGSIAWGTALLIVGGSLFLASVQQVWLNRSLLLGALSLSALPFTLSASGWKGAPGFLPALPLLLLAQALLIIGFIRHAMRPSTRSTLESHPAWTRNIYPIGIGLFLVVQIVLSLWGWDGAARLGSWWAGAAASLLAAILLWATPRFAVLNPVPAHWVQPGTGSGLERIYGALWGAFLQLGRASRTISALLEGDSGIMWILLLLVLFVSLTSQGAP
jgi:hypothetical protein